MSADPNMRRAGRYAERGQKAGRPFVYLADKLAALAVAFVFAFPLLWMISYSLRSTALPAPVQIEWFVPPLAWDNYVRVLAVVPLARYAWNSLVVVVCAVPLTVLCASWAGFALTQLPARARVALLLLCVMLLLVPAPALWLPRFVLYTQLGWINTPFALVAPALMGTSPFYVVMFYVAFARVERELVDSALQEGASLWQVWYRVCLPLARPTVIAVAVLSFVYYWSNFVDPFLYLRSEGNYTLPVGIQLLQESIRSNWPLLMAGAGLMAAPVVLVFIVAQRTFLQGQVTPAKWLR